MNALLPLLVLAFSLSAQPQVAPFERLYLDAVTGALLRREKEVPTLVGPLPDQYDFDDYRTVDGARVPFLMQWSRGDYQVTHRFAEVRQNVTREQGVVARRSLLFAVNAKQKRQRAREGAAV